MKRSTSVNLEESTWQEINDYKDKFDLSSRNDALERIIQEWKMLWMFFNKGSVISTTQSEMTNIDMTKEESAQSRKMSESISEVIDNMPD